MRTAFRTLSLVLLLALGAAACSSDAGTAGDGAVTPAADGALDGNGLEPQAILRQASNDLAAQTVEAEFTMTFAADGQAASASGDMVFDPASERGHMTFVFDELPGMEAGMDMEMIVDGTTLYMRGAFLPDAGWLKLDAKDAGMGQAWGGGSAQMDPSAFLDFLRGVDGIEVVGTEDVRGVETTHFSGTLDLAELAAKAPSTGGKDVREAIDQLERQLGDLTATFDAWVDAEGVPWRVSFGFAPEGADGSFEMTMDVIEIGGDVDIDVPKGKDVTDLGGLNVPPAA